jgi:hypothetical protein
MHEPERRHHRHRSADVVHTSLVYFIDQSGRERYVGEVDGLRVALGYPR